VTHHPTETAIDNVRNGRRATLKAIASSVFAAGLPRLAMAQNNKFSMKLAISLSQAHPTVIGLKAACAEILKDTNGQLAIDVFPNSQLGSDSDTISQVRSGAIRICGDGRGLGCTYP
jgi:TRAP-type C4-dicarboxylate transport system substrate-binding protein